MAVASPAAEAAIAEVAAVSAAAVLRGNIDTKKELLNGVEQFFYSSC